MNKVASVLRLLCLFLGLFSISPGTRAGDTVRLTNGEWPPYLSEQFKHFGLASRIVTEAFALEGVKVEYGFFPWARSLKLAEDGEWAGSVVWRASEERAEKFYISDEVVPDKVVFFHLKRSPFDWKTVASLKGVGIGATLSYQYGPAFDAADAARQITVERAPNDETNMRKLLGERFQVFPVNVDVGYHMLHQLFNEEQIALFTHHPKPLTEEPLRLLLSKKVAGNEQRMNLFNRGLKRLRESGKIDQYTAESRSGLYMGARGRP